jgi:tetratricopeptide (TPR) repeat protein
VRASKGRPPRLSLAPWILALAALTLAWAGSAAPKAAPALSPGTAKMAARLEQIANRVDPKRANYLNEKRAELLRGELARAAAPRERLRLRIELGDELLQAGRSEEAVEHLLAARSEAAELEEAVREPVLARIGELLAISYLRLGEQENCLQHHTADSCLLPIRGGGVHARKRGAEAAIAEYGELLKKKPDDLAYRWLFNLAHMVFGDYPQGVPAAFLIPPAAFDSDFDVGRFPDVAPAVGLASVGRSGGSIVDDFDGDGLLDVVTSSSGLWDPLRFFRNDGRGAFTERTAEAGLTGEIGGLNVIHADYDNDGDLDLLVLRGGWLFDQGEYPGSLLRNRGDGSFEDVTEEAGLLWFHPTHSAAWGDYDNDGWLDLYAGNESTPGRDYPCELYHNNGDGTFTNVAAAAGVDNVGFVKGVSWGDYNNDGLLDLYLSRFQQPNVLYRNDGRAGRAADSQSAPWRFTDVTAEAGVAEPRASFATWFWDYDNDGWLDLFVAPFAGYVKEALATVVATYLGRPHPAETAKLYRNNGDGTFTDVARAARLDRVLLVMGANFGDLDNDGWLDLYLGTGEPSLTTLVPNRMFRNDRGRTFQDVTTSGGFGHLQKGHGISFADIDNDGDQDVRAVLGGALWGDVYQSALFENPGHGNRWITLRLEGVKSNRDAIGARIRLRVRTEQGERSLYATVGAGGSFGDSSLQQELGLGQARSLEAVEITWPATGRTEVYRGLAMDRVWKIREGDPEPVAVPVKAIRLAR